MLPGATASLAVPVPGPGGKKAPAALLVVRTPVEVHVNYSLLCVTEERLSEIRYKGGVFTVRVVENWHRLPRESVDVPGMFMFRLAAALSNLIYLEMCLLIAGGWPR